MGVCPLILVHVCFANKYDGNSAHLCSSYCHTCMQILFSVMRSSEFSLFMIYMAPLYLPFYLSWQSLLEQRLHKPSAASPASQVVGLILLQPSSQVQSRQAVPAALQVPTCFTLVKPAWAQTMHLPPLIFLFHLGAVSEVKLHYCHRCTAQEETEVLGLDDLSGLMKEAAVRDMNN